MLGTVRLDGKRLVIASDFSAGEVAEDAMELCWVDMIPNYTSGLDGRLKMASLK